MLDLIVKAGSMEVVISITGLAKDYLKGDIPDINHLVELLVILPLMQVFFDWSVYFGSKARLILSL